MKIRVIGPLSVIDEARGQLPMTEKTGLVLAYLLIHAGHEVPQRRVMQAVWPELIEQWQNLHNHLGHLRGILGPDQIRTAGARPSSIVELVLSHSDVDLDRFRNQVRLANGPAGSLIDPRESVAHLKVALFEIWPRDLESMANLTHIPFVASWSTALRLERDEAVTDLVRREAQLGPTRDVVDEVRALLEQNPRNVRRAEQLIELLSASGDDDGAHAIYIGYWTTYKESGWRDELERLETSYKLFLHRPKRRVKAPQKAMNVGNLSRDEVELCRRMAVLPGWVTGQTLEYVCAVSDPDHARLWNTMPGLLARGLTEATEPIHPDTRWRLVWTEGPQPSKTTRKSVEDRLVNYVAEWARKKVKVRSSPGQLAVIIDDYELDQPMIEMALEISARRVPNKAMSIASSLKPLWENGHEEVGLRWLKKVLALDLNPARERFAALSAAAGIALKMARPEDAKRWLAEAESMESLGDPVDRALFMNGRAILVAPHDIEAAIGLFSQAVDALTTSGADDLLLGLTMMNLGSSQTVAENMDEASRTLRRALVHLRRLGEAPAIAWATAALANCLWDQGQLAAARTEFENAAEIRRQIGDDINLARTLSDLGGLCLDQGDVSARAYYGEALALANDQDAATVASVLDGCVIMSAQAKRPSLSARFLAVADLMNDESERIRYPSVLRWLARYVDTAAIRSSSTYKAARKAPAEEAVKLAMEFLGEK